MSSRRNTTSEAIDFGRTSVRRYQQQMQEVVNVLPNFES